MIRTVQVNDSLVMETTQLTQIDRFDSTIQLYTNANNLDSTQEMKTQISNSFVSQEPSQSLDQSPDKIPNNSSQLA